MRRTVLRREDGFTLVEILVAVGLIAILTAIAIPIFLNQKKTAHFSAVQTDIQNVLIDLTNRKVDVEFETVVPSDSQITKGSVVSVHTAPDLRTTCVEGYHESDSSRVWHITSVSKKVEDGHCP